MRALFVSFFVFVMAIFGVVGFVVANSDRTAADNEPKVLADSVSVDPADEAILAKVNKVRTDAGVGVLAYSAPMKELTTARVTDMVQRHYYSHKAPEGYNFGDIIRDYDPSSGSSCENLQLQVDADWQAAVDAWVESSAHYKCLTNPSLTRAAGSVSLYDEVSYGNTKTQMYVFAFIATN